MKITKFTEETGWADIEHNGRYFTVRLSDFPNMDAVKAFILSEDEKLMIVPVMSFEPELGKDL